MRQLRRTIACKAMLAMKDHAKHGEFLHNAGLAMVQMAHSEDNREVIRQQGGVDIVLGIMESVVKHKRARRKPNLSGQQRKS